MCTKDGIIDEGCKQCSKPVPKQNFCSDKIPAVEMKCKELPYRWDKKIPPSESVTTMDTIHIHNVHG
jgi:hypothetical protein